MRLQRLSYLYAKLNEVESEINDLTLESAETSARPKKGATEQGQLDRSSSSKKVRRKRPSASKGKLQDTSNRSREKKRQKKT